MAVGSLCSSSTRRLSTIWRKSGTCWVVKQPLPTIWRAWSSSSRPQYSCVWLPILMEMKDVHIDRFIEGYLNYSNHMVYVQQFFSTTWGFGLSWPGYGDGMSFSLGWPHVLMLVAAVAIWRKQQSERRGPVYLFTLLAAAYCFLMTPAALWLWERVSILQPVEFPWRMLGPVAGCVAMDVASLGNRMTRGTG